MAKRKKNTKRSQNPNFPKARTVEKMPATSFGGVIRTTEKGKKRVERLPRRDLQSGKIGENIPTTSFGTAVGTALGKTTQGQLAISYEKAVCSCGGENENCFKCDGTGFYTKKVVQDSSKLTSIAPNSRLGLKNRTPSESTFANDSRGGEYGIRERGRFSSGPLHDDHD